MHRRAFIQAGAVSSLVVGQAAAQEIEADLETQPYKTKVGNGRATHHYSDLIQALKDAHQSALELEALGLKSHAGMYHYRPKNDFDLTGSYQIHGYVYARKPAPPPLDSRCGEEFHFEVDFRHVNPSLATLSRPAEAKLRYLLDQRKCEEALSTCISRADRWKLLWDDTCVLECFDEGAAYFRRADGSTVDPHYIMWMSEEENVKWGMRVSSKQGRVIT